MSIGDPAIRDEAVPQSEIRRRNLSRLLTALHLDGPQTRSQLAARLRVNRSTVASLAADLASRGLVSERRARQGAVPTPGRPSPVVELRSDSPAVLALEVSTDWLRAAVVSMGGIVIAAETHDQAVALMSPEEVADQLRLLAAPLLAAEAPTRPILAVGASVPGGVRVDDGFVTHAPNLGWKDQPFGSMLRHRFAGLPVAVGNDADLAALAEHLRGSGRGTSDFVCLWGEGGIGAGFVISGRPVAGAAGLAGEVGHMTVDPEGTVCHCGARGCWEALVGEEALLRRAGRSPMAGREGLSAVLRGAADGDDLAQDALTETGRWLGIGIAGLINVFNPSRVALGGVYARIYPQVREALDREVEARAMAAARRMVTILPVELGGQALLLGAAELAFTPVLEDPTILPAHAEGRRPRSAARDSAVPIRSSSRRRGRPPVAEKSVQQQGGGAGG